MPDRPLDPDASALRATEELDRLQQKHQKCDDRLAELRSRLLLSADEKIEESHLKKQKLLLKDRMEALTRAAQGAPVTGRG